MLIYKAIIAPFGRTDDTTSKSIETRSLTIAHWPLKAFRVSLGKTLKIHDNIMSVTQWSTYPQSPH